VPKVAKVLVYWEDSDTPHEMTRKEFMDSEQGTFTASLFSSVEFAQYFKGKWENE